MIPSYEHKLKGSLKVQASVKSGMKEPRMCLSCCELANYGVSKSFLTKMLSNCAILFALFFSPALLFVF